MMERKTWLLLTFYTTAGAMKWEKICKEKNLPGRLIPVPRSITADCGLAWRCEISLKERLQSLASDVDVENWYEIEL